VFNQYDSLVRPLQAWLAQQGVHFALGCAVTALDHRSASDGRLVVTAIHTTRSGRTERIGVDETDLVILQNGSMTDSSSLGSMTQAPTQRVKAEGGGWTLWERLAQDRPDFGNPKAFNTCIAQSCWASFTVTLKNPDFFAAMEDFSGNEAGTGGLVTFKDSNWLMSIVLAFQPHFINQPADVQVFWGYGLRPDRIGDFVPKSMAQCNGAEIMQELCGHLRFDLETVASGNCIPCRMPYITSMFMPRMPGDRPLPVPRSSKNLAFVSQFVELPDDVVFTVEYSVRAAQTAIYELLDIQRRMPPVTPHDKSVRAGLEALLKAFV
jgi:oleate hydratase